jgi:hypothetical protein
MTYAHWYRQPVSPEMDWVKSSCVQLSSRQRVKVVWSKLNDLIFDFLSIKILFLKIQSSDLDRMTLILLIAYIHECRLHPI